MFIHIIIITIYIFKNKNIKIYTLCTFSLCNNNNNNNNNNIIIDTYIAQYPLIAQSDVQ